jgi:hypothetical protein
MAVVTILQVEISAVGPGDSGVAVLGQLATPGQVVLGLLRDNDGGGDRILAGETVASTPGFYEIKFQHVPDGDYTIEIYGSPGIRLLWRGCIVDSTLPKSHHAKLPVLFDTHITNPSNDNTKEFQTFLVSGTATSSQQPTGTMTPVSGAGGSIAGINASPGTFWTLQFNIPTCSPPNYNLTVSVPGSGTDQKSNITIIPVPSNNT